MKNILAFQDKTEFKKEKRSIIWKNNLSYVVIPLLILFTWQVSLSVLNVPVYFLPKPTDIVSAAVENWRNLTLALGVTVIEALVGFILSIIIGILGAILLATSKVVEKITYPYIIILQTIPIVAIASIIVIWFGAGMNAIIIITFLMGFFPMLSNTLLGLKSTDQNLKDLFNLYEASKFQTLLHLKILYALPYMVAGLKISSTLVVIGAIVGEYVAGVGGGKGGLGFAITQAALRLQTPYLFACALTAALLGISFFYIVGKISNIILSSWHESEMQKEN